MVITKEVKNSQTETEETFFRRDNPDPFVQAAFKIIDNSKGKEVSEKEIEYQMKLAQDQKTHDKVRQEKALKVLHQKWHVPARIIENLSNLRETKAVKVTNRFKEASKKGWILILSADKGTGKSTAAASWLLSQVKDVHIETTHKQIRRWWSGTRLARVSSYTGDFEKICMLPVIVIDDLGVEYLDKNGNFLQKLDELIDERYSNYRKTIITTNLNAVAFRDRYGERVADRIREGFKHGGGFFEISDSSMRVESK